MQNLNCCRLEMVICEHFPPSLLSIYVTFRQASKRIARPNREMSIQDVLNEIQVRDKMLLI